MINTVQWDQMNLTCAWQRKNVDMEKLFSLIRDHSIMFCIYRGVLKFIQTNIYREVNKKFTLALTFRHEPLGWTDDFSITHPVFPMAFVSLIGGSQLSFILQQKVHVWTVSEQWCGQHRGGDKIYQYRILEDPCKTCIQSAAICLHCNPILMQCRVLNFKLKIKVKTNY